MEDELTALNEKLRDRITRQTRLVKFEKTQQGNTVIHRRMDLSARTLIISDRADYEEHLQPAPPLLQVDQTIAVPSLHSKHVSSGGLPKIPSTVDQQLSVKSEFTLAFPSAHSLSPIREEEDEELDVTDGISFGLLSQNSLTMKPSSDHRGDIAGFLVNDNDKRRSDQHRATLETTRPSNDQLQLESPSDQSQHVLVTPSSVSTTRTSTSKVQLSTETRSIKSQASKTITFVTDIQHAPVAIAPTDEESISTQAFDVEHPTEDVHPTAPMVPVAVAVFHRVGGRIKRSKKKKKSQRADRSNERQKPKRTALAASSSPPEPIIVVPRKAVPFVSAQPNEQIDVEEDIRTRRPKKKRKRSGTLPRHGCLRVISKRCAKSTVSLCFAIEHSIFVFNRCSFFQRTLTVDDRRDPHDRNPPARVSRKRVANVGRRSQVAEKNRRTLHQ